MTFYLRAGNALACKINHHRQGWDGSICSGAASWECGAQARFREDKCEIDIPHCFHRGVFGPVRPSFEADRNVVERIFSEGDLEVLNDQVLFFWAPACREPHGMVRPERFVVVGAYRIQSCEYATGRGYFSPMIFYPYDDGWTRFPKVEIDRPRHEGTGGAYLKQIEPTTALRVLDDVDYEIESQDVTWFDSEDERRCRHFHDHLEEWLEIAKERWQVRAPAKPVGRTFTFGDVPSTSTSQFAAIAADLRAKERAEAQGLPAVSSGIVGVRVSPQSVTTTEPPATEPAIDLSPVPLLDDELLGLIADGFGEELARALAVATASKPFLVLRGASGVGKSYLAVQLLARRAVERIIVPVAATWRGREDLLGYVNPVTSRFEPTAFTRFLHRAAQAWEAGSREPWVVVLEEFNLSQPEHWMTDILTLSQLDNLEDRWIDLHGSFDDGDSTIDRVLLSPAVRFIATINYDHTVVPLSPRFLDRAALVEVQLSPGSAIDRVGLELEPEQREAIADLDYELRDRETTFSVRTAKSLAECWRIRDQLGLDDWAVLDWILVQEVLSKIRLHAGDPSDLELLERLDKWQTRHGNQLNRCAAMVVGWRERLESGNDVVQA